MTRRSPPISMETIKRAVAAFNHRDLLSSARGVIAQMKALKVDTPKDISFSPQQVLSLTFAWLALGRLVSMNTSAQAAAPTGGSPPQRLDDIQRAVDSFDPGDLLDVADDGTMKVKAQKGDRPKDVTMTPDQIVDLTYGCLALGRLLQASMITSRVEAPFYGHH